MTTTFAPFTSLDGIDIDSFIMASMPYLDKGTLVWPAGVTTVEGKVAHARSLIDTFMGYHNFYGHTQSIDGYMVGVMLGVRSNTQFVNTLTFLRPDANGSRAYNYNPEGFAAWKAFLASEGFDAVQGVMEANSPLHTVVAAVGVDEYGQKADPIRADHSVDLFTLRVK